MAITAIAHRYSADQRVYNGTLLANDATPKAAPGVRRKDAFGREFVYVQTRDALTIGQPVRQSTGTSAASISATVTANNIRITTTNPAAGFSGALAFDTVGSQLPAAAVDSYKGWYLTINIDAAQWGDTYRIVGNTATTVTLDRGLDTALATNDTASIWSCFVVELAGGTATYSNNKGDQDGINDTVVGIALTTVSASNYTWVQVKGLNPTCVIRTRQTVSSMSLSPYPFDSTTYFPPFVTAGSTTAGTLESVVMTGVQSGAAATNIEITQAIQGSRIRPVAPLVLQASAVTQPAPLYLDCYGLGD